MHILALETSGMSGSLAALDDEQPLAEISLNESRRTAQSLAPALRDLLLHVGWKPQDVNLVVVTQGPGSFTGLRIGVTTAKAFAYATGAALLGVNTLQVVAHQVPRTDTRLWVVLNAERDQLFGAAFRHAGGQWLQAEPACILDNQDWLSRLADRDLVSGPGLRCLREQLSAGVHVVDESHWMPRATSVGQVGFRAYRAGERSDCWSLLPEYFRECAAVEKARATQARTRSDQTA